MWSEHTEDDSSNWLLPDDEDSLGLNRNFAAEYKEPKSDDEEEFGVPEDTEGMPKLEDNDDNSSTDSSVGLPGLAERGEVVDSSEEEDTIVSDSGVKETGTEDSVPNQVKPTAAVAEVALVATLPEFSTRVVC